MRVHYCEGREWMAKNYPRGGSAGLARQLDAVQAAVKECKRSNPAAFVSAAAAASTSSSPAAAAAAASSAASSPSTEYATLGGAAVQAERS